MNKVVYACNDKYFDGLYLSILSILRRSQETYCFYLLTGNFEYLDSRYTSMNKKHENLIRDLVKSFNINNDFIIIDTTDDYNKLIKGFKNEKTHYSPYTTLRLLLDKYDYFKTGLILYIDVDAMACKDIKEMFEFNLGNNEFAVAHDALGRYWQYKDCFNAGIMLFNMDMCHKTNLFAKAREVIHKKRMYFPDQSALNEAVSNFMFFPGNDSRYNNQTRKIKDDTVIKHFCAHIVGWPKHNNIKQWEIEKVHQYLKFTMFDEDYKLFLDMKKKNNE